MSVITEYLQFALMQMDTGVVFYTTTATVEEILRANNNLKAKGLSLRYVQPDTSLPSLHAGVCAAV